MADVAVTPLTGGLGPVIAATLFDLAPLGYSQAEYILAGTASAYDRQGDGLSVVEEARYATRVLVYRPTDAARFNGTVFVEWLNVTGGLDAGPDWGFTHTELMRAGAAWVGVSAQQLGVTGGTGTTGMSGPGLVGTDPERYGALHHPGDRFSFDIYSQAGAAVRATTGTILEGLAIERVVAIGESQSAFRLTTYVNDVDPVVREYDGFFVHARFGPGAPLHDDSPGIDVDGPPVPFRADLRVPVMCVEAETDLLVLRYLGARQDDAEHFVLWEIAGTAHADVYTFVGGMIDTGALPLEELVAAWTPSSEYYGFITLDKPVNAGPQHYVLNAAVSHFERWLRDGTHPPSAPRLEVENGAYVVDDYGNVRGGIRSPHVDVPTALLSGLGNHGSEMAFLCGSTTPFDHDRLAELYPSKRDYVARFAAATDAAVAAGFFLAADADEIKAVAAARYPLD